MRHPLSKEKSKRALFQSPTVKEEVKKSSPVKNDQKIIQQTFKRALFSPERPLDEVKRRKIEGDSASSSYCDKLYRSQSFGGASSFDGNRTMAAKSNSDVSKYFESGTELPKHHKQKLLWSVSNVLKAKNISSSHLNYKVYALALTKVVKICFQRFNYAAISSTSEKMKSIANRCVNEVLNGVSVEEILLKEADFVSSATAGNNKWNKMFANENDSLRTAAAATTSTSEMGKAFSKSIQENGSRAKTSDTILRENVDRPQAKVRANLLQSFESSSVLIAPPPIIKFKSEAAKVKRQISFDI